MLANTKPRQNLYSWYPQILNVRRAGLCRKRCMISSNNIILRHQYDNLASALLARGSVFPPQSRTEDRINREQRSTWQHSVSCQRAYREQLNMTGHVPAHCTFGVHSRVLLSDVYRCETGEPHVIDRAGQAGNNGSRFICVLCPKTMVDIGNRARETTRGVWGSGSH